MKATVLTESSFIFSPGSLHYTYVMIQAGVALFPSLKHFLSFHFSRFSFYIIIHIFVLFVLWCVPFPYGYNAPFVHRNYWELWLSVLVGVERYEREDICVHVVLARVLALPNSDISGVCATHAAVYTHAHDNPRAEVCQEQPQVVKSSYQNGGKFKLILSILCKFH